MRWTLTLTEATTRMHTYGVIVLAASSPCIFQLDRTVHARVHAGDIASFAWKMLDDSLPTPINDDIAAVTPAEVVQCSS